MNTIIVKVCMRTHAGFYFREHKAWQGMLKRLVVENTICKNMLAELLKKGISDQKLEEAEIYQQGFIKTDQVLALMRRDIYLQQRGIEKHGMQSQEMRQQKLLRKDMGRIVQEFEEMKICFFRMIDG